MGSPSYLVRNQYSYCFRLHVPADLQVYVGKKELRYSLRTGYLSDAKFKARFYAAGVQLLFRRLRELKSMKLNDDQIKEFVKAYFEQQLQKLPSEFRPGKIRILEGIAANVSAYISPREHAQIDGFKKAAAPFRSDIGKL